MRIKVLYFGILGDLAGVADEMAEIVDGATVKELLRFLRARTSNDAMANDDPSVSGNRLWRSVAVAVNREYATDEAVLCDGDEVALLPPVSGGGFRKSVRSGRDGDARNGRARC